MKTSIINLFLLPALSAGLGLIPTGRVTAQTFTTLYSFTASFNNVNYYTPTNSDGDYPQAGLILSGNTLYGTANDGGTNGSGTVFAVNTDGTGFTVLHTFTDGSDGGYPQAGLILSGNTLYGTAVGGGSAFSGTVFSISTNGTGFTTLHTFSAVPTNLLGFYTNSDGAGPQAGLILSGNTLYGTANDGGSSDSGTVFAVNTNGTGFTNLHSFTMHFNLLGTYTNTDGAFPNALILSGNTLYGTAVNGGINDNGTVFSLFIPPQLTIIRSAANVILTWPTNATGFTLQSTTNLVSPAVWITNSPAPVVVNGQNAVTNPISGTQKFYRLTG